jgi:hypothetical protein
MLDSLKSRASEVALVVSVYPFCNCSGCKYAFLALFSGLSRFANQSTFIVVEAQGLPSNEVVYIFYKNQFAF